jgi:hypothetical protein
MTTDGQLKVSDFLISLGFMCLLLNLVAVFFLKRKTITYPGIIYDTHQDDEVQALLEFPARYDDLENDFQEYAEEREERALRPFRQRDHSLYTGIASSVIHSDLGVDMDEMEPGILIETNSCFWSPLAYLLGINMVVTVGVGLMYINNIGAISILILT